MIEGQELALLAGRQIQEKHGKEVKLLDVRGRSDVTDYFLLVTGLNPPHLKALASEVDRLLKSNGVKARRMAGKAESGWVVLDCWSVIIHLFLEDMRLLYDLESLWSDADEVSLEEDGQQSTKRSVNDV